MAKDKKDNKVPEGIEVEHQNVLPVNIVKEMEVSYLDYAMSVIVARALPDVRDGLKPVHRRILFSMHKSGLSFSAKYKKSATVVGDVLGSYHPHGDSSVYDAMVRMAQDFSMRYPTISGQGNFGSIDGDGAAAYRYTEAKMARISEELLRDIEKDTVDFVSNYDGRLKEPTVLPAVIPNLLLNGTMGIAVGMATKIPPHNLGEVMDALIHMTDNPESTTDDLMQFIKGPDFPTAGIIFNEKDIKHAYASGRGGVMLRGEAEIVENKAGTFQIIISSIPYQINKSDLIVKIADLVREKKVEGIRDIRDESTRDIRIVIDLKTGVLPQQILNTLYKNTELETMFHYNMLALVDGVPKLLSLESILDEFIKHRNVVVVRRTKYDLEVALAREHILLGLKIALDHIDEVIKTIRASKDTETAHGALMKKFKLSDLQATAILEMRLQKLAGLERQKVEDELKEKQALIKELRAILADPKKVLKIIKDEFTVIRDKYGDDRKTKVVKHGAKEINVEDLVAEKENVLVVTSGGYVKRTDPSEYRAQKRGGVGVIDLNMKEEDFVTIFLTANTHDDLLFFTDKGKAYQIKMYDIPEGKRATRGKSATNFLSISSDERITSVLAVPKTEKGQTGKSLMMVTKLGVAKKVSAGSFSDVRRSGIIAIKLQDGDELLSVLAVAKGDDVIMATKFGQSIRFKESDIREMGRAAAGVTGMKLKKGDVILGANGINDVNKDGEYLVMTSNGYGKKTKLKEYKVQKRGGSGIKTAEVTKKTGELMASQVICSEESEVIAVSKQGQIIRTSLAEIPTLGRQTQGVRIMKLREGDTVASLTCL